MRDRQTRLPDAIGRLFLDVTGCRHAVSQSYGTLPAGAPRGRAVGARRARQRSPTAGEGRAAGRPAGTRHGFCAPLTVGVYGTRRRSRTRSRSCGTRACRLRRSVTTSASGCPRERSLPCTRTVSRRCRTSPYIRRPDGTVFHVARYEYSVNCPSPACMVSGTALTRIISSALSVA